MHAYAHCLAAREACAETAPGGRPREFAAFLGFNLTQHTNQLQGNPVALTESLMGIPDGLGSYAKCGDPSLQRAVPSKPNSVIVN